MPFHIGQPAPREGLSAAETCGVCGAADTLSVDFRASVPVMMHRIYETVEAARAAERGTLDVVACQGCGFVWNRAFDSGLIDYDEQYENEQTYSLAFNDHVMERVADVVAAVPSDDEIRYLEVGSGQGGFIEKVAKSAGVRLRTAEGFDPAWRGNNDSFNSLVKIHKSYFDERSAHLLQCRPNVVVSRHTIEHVPDPIAFLTTIRRALGPEADAKVFIETPCVEWILQHLAMQDFFYEHCSLFTAASLGYALARSGFGVVGVRHVFGGQYLWCEATTISGPPSNPPRRKTHDDYADARSRFVKHWRHSVELARRDGGVAIWGAGAKGVTFAGLVDPDNVLLDHAIDVNPNKQGRHLAGSGLIVLAPEAAVQRAPRTIFVMNPNYLSEVRVLAENAGIAARLVPLD